MKKLRLLEQARAAFRVRRDSLRTETRYVQWIKPVLGNSSIHTIYPSGTSR